MKDFMLIVITVLAIILFYYARYVEPYKIIVKHQDLNLNLNTKILHMSDIHFGKSFDLIQLQKLVSMINKEDVDVIVFTGDFFASHFKGDIRPIVEVLLTLKADVHKYAIWGNHDYEDYASSVYEDLMIQSKFTLLKNTHEIINIHDTIFNIVGSDDYIHGQFNRDVLTSMIKDTSSDYNILLLHEPDIADHVVDSHYDLILSGHSHGGQIQLPFGISGRTKFGVKYKEGLFRLSSKTLLYVSSGLGVSGLRLRFRVIPSYTIIKL